MHLTEVFKKYNLPDNIEQVLLEHGYGELFPPQKTALKSGVLDDKNFVLAMPTASGKTFIAELCMLKSILNENGKCLYVVPLKALASEKAEDFRKKYSSAGIKVGLATGDYDVPSPSLENYQILVATAEKVDSLLRLRASWLSEQISLAVFDEIHYINDSSRGPTLEILITRLREVNPQLKILALSATIKNANQIADWLDAHCLLSHWRPVALEEGVYYNNKIYFKNGHKKPAFCASSNELGHLADETVRDNGQVLVFVNSRRSTQSTAREIGRVLRLHLDKECKEKLEQLSNSIKKSAGEETETDKKLAEVVKNGAAFHHAGLRNSERKIIEDAFKENVIKVICATPTLAAGVNLPARRVIIRDHSRYEAGYGSNNIAVFEYKQMCGRAGRPKYDKYGESILMAKSQEQVDSLFEEFINADSEPIISKLGSENALRMHLLAAISSDYVRDKDGLLNFLSKTFFSVQQNTEDLGFIIERTIDLFLEEEMIERNDSRFKSTAFGHLISRLYIDPLTGVILRNGLIGAKYNENLSALSFLHLICSTPDMAALRVGKTDYLDVDTYSSLHQKEFLIPIQSRYHRYDSYLECLTRIKTAWLLEQWCSEESEEKICRKFGTAPGDIHRYIATSDWLLYTCQQLSRLFNIIEISASLEKLRQRLKYGIKEDVLELVKLNGIGRVRSRALLSAGIKNLEDIKKAKVENLSKIPYIGNTLAASIKDQVS